MRRCTGLYIVGHFFNRGGYADMAHQYALACKSIGLPAKLLVTGEAIPEVEKTWREMVDDSQCENLGSDPVVIIVDIPPRFRLVDSRGVSRVIGSTIFEGDSIPLEWVNHCGLVDEIWVPTDFNLRSFSNAGVSRELMKKMPLSIDTDFWNNNHPGNKFNKVNNRVVNLLYVCSLHRRKGLDKLLEAYYREFSLVDNVNLTISCFPIRSGGLNGEAIYDDSSMLDYLKKLGEKLSGRATNFPSLTAHYNYWSEDNLRKLFFESDAYVSTERADGWALPVMQMMSLCKPTMLLGWGGSSEYANQENAYIIPPGPLELVDPNLSASTSWYRGQRWPQMSINDVRKKLRELVTDIRSGVAEVVAEKAKATVMEYYTYSALGNRIAKAVGWSKDNISMSNDGGTVAIRSAPYIGTSLHCMLSKVRAYIDDNRLRSIVICTDSSEIAKDITQLAEQLRIKLDCISYNEIRGKRFGDNVTVILFSPRHVNCSEKNTHGSPLYYAYDLVRQILVPFDMFSGIRKPAVYLSGGLTDAARKILIGRGLDKCPLITHVPIDNQPGSWSIFKERLSPRDAKSFGITSIFIADEDAYLQRQSYQQAELAFENAEIFYLQPPSVPQPLIRLKDGDLFKRGLPKRWRGANYGKLRNVLVIPGVSGKRALANLLIRLSYFFPAELGFHIEIPVDPSLLGLSELDLSDIRFSYGFDTYGNLCRLPIGHIELIDRFHLSERLLIADTLHWTWSASDLSGHFRRLLSLSDNLLFVDVDNDGMRSGFASAYALYFSQSREDVAGRRLQSLNRLKSLVNKLRAQRKKYVVAFGTGPSLAEAFEHDFSDSITIACNTMVKDASLLNHIRPSIIVASDADFHFGPSKYAQQFRIDLCKALLNCNAMFVCPEAHVDLLVTHHPEIEDRIIGIPVDGSGTNYDLIEEMRVRAIDNVLLQFLLPLSSTIGNKIRLIGFDGRRKSDKKFWNHNVNTQYPELMDTIEHSHPGFFFHRSYTDYFDRHCKLIEEYVLDIESSGGELKSLTDSAVPALSSRLVN